MKVFSKECDSLFNKNASGTYTEWENKYIMERTTFRLFSFTSIISVFVKKLKNYLYVSVMFQIYIAAIC